MLTLSLVFALVLRKCSSSQVFWILAWPGTVVHEVLHYTVGFALNAQPTKISIFPEPRDGMGQTHGYVDFDNLTWYNALPTGMAPFLGVFVAFFLASFVTNDMTWTNMFWAWLVAAVLAQSWPSGQDFAVAFGNVPGLTFYSSVILGCYFISG